MVFTRISLHSLIRLKSFSIVLVELVRNSSVRFDLKWLFIYIGIANMTEVNIT